MRSAVPPRLEKRVSRASLSTYPYSIVKEASGVDALKTEQERQEETFAPISIEPELSGSGRFLST
jgi:hypothetical protein